MIRLTDDLTLIELERTIGFFPNDKTPHLYISAPLKKDLGWEDRTPVQVLLSNNAFLVRRCAPEASGARMCQKTGRIAVKELNEIVGMPKSPFQVRVDVEGEGRTRSVIGTFPAEIRESLQGGAR